MLKLKLLKMKLVIARDDGCFTAYYLVVDKI